MAIKKLPSTGDMPRSTGVPDSLVSGGSADSAGFPWAGRTFDHHVTAFAGDDGKTPEKWQEAVSRIRQLAAELGEANFGEAYLRARAQLADAHARALSLLSSQRLLVPLVAEAGDLGLTSEGKVVEKTQELSIVTVAAPDGRRVMPVFSSVDTMRVWNPGARPIPVPAPQAAIAAAEERTDLIIIDAGSSDLEFGVRRTCLEPLAVGTPWLPSWHDPQVLEAFERAVSPDERIRGADLEPGDPEGRLLTPELDVTLQLVPGLQQEQVRSLIAAFQQRLSAEEVIAARVDSMRLALR